MPARIRLQIKGHPANRFFWIVASSSKLNPRGRPTERMGYWFPDRKTVYNDRSIVLNRPRLKYWIGQGAEVTDGAYKVLSMAGFLPKKPPPFGSNTLYKKPAWLPGPEPPTPLEPDLGAAEEIRDQIEENEKMAQLRKEQYVENARSQFHTQDLKPSEEIQKHIEKYHLYFNKLKEIIPNTPADRLKAFLAMTSLKASEGILEELNPEEIAQKLKISLDKAKKIHNLYQTSIQSFEQADVDDYNVNLSRKHRVKKFKPGDKVYVPIYDPITPLPDFEDFLVYPGNFHDIKTPLKPNKEYDAWFEQKDEDDRDYKKSSSKSKATILGPYYGKSKS